MVLDNGITAVFNSLTWDVDGFAVASGYDEAADRYIGKRLAPIEWRAPHGMAETERLLLAGEDRVALLEGRRGLGLLQLRGLVATFRERVFQLVGRIEMIFDRALVRAR